MRILVIERDALSRTLLVRAIEQMGHEVDAAATGDRAARIAADRNVDVAVCDWSRSREARRALIQQLHGAHDGPPVYVIQAIPSAHRRDALEALASGADDYVSVPIERAEVAARLLIAQRTLELRARIDAQARTDALTDCGNRVGLWELLGASEDRARRYGEGYALGVLDVDAFRAYGESCGGAKGEELLRTVGRALRAQVRRSDSVFRIDGDRFALVFPNQAILAARVVLNRLRKGVEALAIPHPANEPWRVVTLSAGAAEQEPGTAVPADVLVERADGALRRAKMAGGNRVICARTGAAVGDQRSAVGL